MADPVPWTLDAGGEYTEELAWLTDVMRSPTGGSQHRRLRQSPRTTIGFSALESGDRRRWMDLLLRTCGVAPWWCPVSIDARPLDVAANVGASVLNVDPDGARFVAGGRALVAGPDPRHHEVVETDTVGPSSLSLVDPLAFAWPAGTQVVPLRRGRLADVPSVGRFTADDSALVPLRFRLEQVLDSDPAIPGTAYRDFPVFDFIAPVWTSDPTWSPERQTAVSDDGIGVPYVAATADQAEGKTVMQYAAVGAELATLRSALFALAGRWAPAWVPSWTHDLRVVANVSAGAITLDVAGPLLSTVALASNHRDIRIELDGGAVLYRRIASVAAHSASVDRLTLDAALPDAFTVQQVRMACFISLCTQDSDVNTLRYFGPDALQCELSWRELAHAF